MGIPEIVKAIQLQKEGRKAEAAEQLTLFKAKLEQEQKEEVF